VQCLYSGVVVFGCPRGPCLVLLSRARCTMHGSRLAIPSRVAGLYRFFLVALVAVPPLSFPFALLCLESGIWNEYLTDFPTAAALFLLWHRVQEECSGEIERVESQMFSLMQTNAKYFRERAKLAEHWSKHPHILDFKQALMERDQLEYFTLRIFLRDIRSNFATLHDLICKNLDKILKPKGDEDDSSGRNMMMM
jgi:hypothetical protein